MKTGVSRVRALPAAVLFALAAAVPAFAAQDQAELLSFSSGREVTLRAVEQALREADPREQLDWTFTVRPSLLHRRYLDERGGELVRPRVSATLQVRFGEKPLDAVRREARLERTLRAHDRAGRLEVRSALLAHAELLLAQDAFRTAREALDDLPADAPALERTSKELTRDKAEAALSSARREAAGYGVSGEAVWRSLRFAAPPVPDIAELSAYRLQELAVAEAEVRLLQAGGAGIVKDFRLGLGWRTDSTELDLETGLMAGRPGLRLGSIHPGGRERLEFRLSAELALSDDLSRLGLFEEELLFEQQELERLESELDLQLQLARQEAELADADLAYAEAELSTASGAAEQRLTTRVYRAWITYVRRHHDLLEAAEGTWHWR